VPPAENTAEFPSVLPPPPPWGGAQPLSDLVSAALQAPAEAAVEPPLPEAEASIEPEPAPEPQPAPPSSAEIDIDIDIDIELELDDDSDGHDGHDGHDDREVDLETLELLDAPPRLLGLLRQHFRGGDRQVRVALDRFFGAFTDRDEYIELTLEAQGVPSWVIPYVDAESLIQDWLSAGAIWILEDPGDDGDGDDQEHPPALYVFRG